MKKILVYRGNPAENGGMIARFYRTFVGRLGRRAGLWLTILARRVMARGAGTVYSGDSCALSRAAVAVKGARRPSRLRNRRVASAVRRRLH